jgi:Uri superfamily endonuclease
VIPRAPGTYILVLGVSSPRALQVGRAGVFNLVEGAYFYVGSAHGPGGLAARVGRHVRLHKPCRWHVDYLRAESQVLGAFVRESSERLECFWAWWLKTRAACPVNGFGASDCRCATHLFRLPEAVAFGQVQRIVTGELDADFVAFPRNNDHGVSY